jgi:hypothetical protein
MRFQAISLYQGRIQPSDFRISSRFPVPTTSGTLWVISGIEWPLSYVRFGSKADIELSPANAASGHQTQTLIHSLNERRIVVGRSRNLKNRSQRSFEQEARNASCSDSSSSENSTGIISFVVTPKNGVGSSANLMVGHNGVQFRIEKTSLMTPCLRATSGESSAFACGIIKNTERAVRETVRL